MMFADWAHWINSLFLMTVTAAATGRVLPHLPHLIAQQQWELSTMAAS
jgi:hypothetical protein